MTDEMISTEEAANILGITIRAVQGLCQRGTLESKKFSGVWLVSRASVSTYKARKEASKGQHPQDNSY